MKNYKLEIENLKDEGSFEIKIRNYAKGNPKGEIIN